MTPTSLDATRRHARLPGTLLGTAALLAACGGAALLIPLFEFTFSDTRLVYQGDTYELGISLAGTVATGPTGTLSPTTLEVLTPVAQSLPVTGTYDNCTLDLRVGGAPQPPIDSRYNGRFVDNDTLVLSPVNLALPAIRFLRDPKGSRDMGCS
jgi:hypothetical protein